MEELNKKVIGNAVSAYFMVFVSVFFLWSKKPYINHEFVRSHVKSAFSLHLMMAVMLFIMSYPFFRGTHILGYSLNTIITASLSLLIFAGILYGMYMAHKWKRVTLWEIFHKTGVSKDLITTSRSEKISEENSLILMLAHVPFLGYIVYPRHKELSHIRDIAQLNLIVTLLCVLIYIAWYASLASLIMLAYIIYSVFQSIRLALEDEITTLNLDKIPTVEEKYIMQKSLIHYVWNNLKKLPFVPFQKIVTDTTTLYKQQEAKDEESITEKRSFHIKNFLVLVLLAALIVFILGWDSPVLILFLFPICYAYGYNERRAYRMPYIYDIYAFFSRIFSRVWHIFHKTRKLQKTQIKETVKMWEQKK